MEYPLVSAIVLCYNQAQFVVECLESVRLQDYPNLELIIHDDASKDDSAGVIQAWLAKSNMPHRFLRQEINRGLCHSLNYAVSHASGNYISAIAADDVWLPGKLLVQVELMERLPENVGVVYSDAFQMNESGKLLPQKFIEAHRHFETMPEGNIQKILWEGNFIPAMTTLVRRECYRKAGPFDETLFYEDWDMWLRISRSFKFIYSHKITAKYRYVATSMVRSQKTRMLDATCQMCIKHLKHDNLLHETKRVALLQLYEHVITSVRRMTPEYKRNLLQALQLAMEDTQAFKIFWRVLGGKIISRAFQQTGLY